MALALVRCSIEADQGGTPHARARVSLVSWEGRSHALLFMVPLGLPSARPMAQALRLPLILSIIESVNSISRDERGFPFTQYITNGRISRAGYTITRFKHHHRVLWLISNRMSV